jgi:hypothetical protein
LEAALSAPAGTYVTETAETAPPAPAEMAGQAPPATSGVAEPSRGEPTLQAALSESVAPEVMDVALNGGFVIKTPATPNGVTVDWSESDLKAAGGITFIQGKTEGPSKVTPTPGSADSGPAGQAAFPAPDAPAAPPSSAWTIAEAPAPQAPSGPLEGFTPCSQNGQGHGTVTSLRGVFVAPARYILFISLTGQWGAYSTGEALDETPGVFYSVFEGPYRSFVDFSREFQGPVALTRLTVQDGALRATLNFLDSQAPASVKVTTFCRGGELALIHDFTEAR